MSTISTNSNTSKTTIPSKVDNPQPAKSLHPDLDDSYYFYQITATIYLQMQLVSACSKTLDHDYRRKLSDIKLNVHEFLEWIGENYGYRTEYLREDLLSQGC